MDSADFLLLLPALLLLILRAVSSLEKLLPIAFFNVERVVVAVPLRASSAFLRDVRNLPMYEQKVSSSALLPVCRGATHPKLPTLAYTLAGGWCGIPWTAAFSMVLTPNGGFHSRGIELEPGRRGLTRRVMDIHGGFVLRSAGEGRTVVIHYESYRWSGLVLPLRIGPVYRGVAKWHRDGMQVEMDGIKVGMEAAWGREEREDGATVPEAVRSLIYRRHLTIGRFIWQQLSGRKFMLGDITDGNVQVNS